MTNTIIMAMAIILRIETNNGTNVNDGDGGRVNQAYYRKARKDRNLFTQERRIVYQAGGHKQINY